MFLRAFYFTSILLVRIQLCFDFCKHKWIIITSDLRASSACLRLHTLGDWVLDVRACTQTHTEGGRGRERERERIKCPRSHFYERL